MDETLLNFRAVEQGTAHSSNARETRDIDGHVISSRARRRFLQNSGLVSLSPSLSAVAHTLPELYVRRIPDGFAFFRYGVIVWTVSTAWFSGPAKFKLCNTNGVAELTLTDAFLPGSNVRCDVRLRMTVKNSRTRVEILHALTGANREVDLEDWLDGRAAVTLGRHVLPLEVTVGSHASMKQTGSAELFLEPDLSLHLSSPDAFEVNGREVHGRFDTCEIRPARYAGVRLLNVDDARAMRLVLHAGATQRARAQPRQISTALRCPEFEISCIVFEVQERPRHAPLTGYLVDASDGVPLRLHSANSLHPQPRVTVVADGLSFGRVASAIPVSALSARTTLVNVTTDNVMLTGRCVDDRPLRIVENDDASTRLSRSIVWTHGALRDHDGVSARLLFREPPDAGHRRDVTDILDAIPWHKKTISLDDVIIEFARAADGLWLRAQLQGYVLKQRAGRFVVARAVNDGSGARPATGLKWFLPAQSFSEQSFFEAPAGWKKQHSNRSGVPIPAGGIRYNDAPADKRQEINFDVADLQRSRPDGDNDALSETTPSALRVAAESVLVMKPGRSFADDFELSLQSLLNPDAWTLHVAPEASSDELHWRQALADVQRHGREEFTHIEVPWRVTISPDEKAHLSTSSLALTPEKNFHPLFFIEPRGELNANASSLPLRAITSPDHFEGLWLHYGAAPPPGNTGMRRYADPVRTNLDEQDRNELVWLSGTWGQLALLGTANVRARTKDDPKPTICTPPVNRPCNEFGIYVPQPFVAARLLLTAFGASLRSAGTWDPPSFHLEHPDVGEATTLAMSIEEWTHRSTLARDDFDRVVYRGFLLPYGFRVALVKMTVREIRRIGKRGLMAVPMQRYFLRVEDGEKAFPAAMGQPLESRNDFFQPERFKLSLDRDLQIDDPSDPTYSLNNLGASAFWVRAPNADGKDGPYLFPITIGADGLGSAPLVFVSNAVVHDINLVTRVVDVFNEAGGSTLNAKGSRITYAPSTRTGDTRFVTQDATVKAVVNTSLVNSAVLEEQHLPPFFPILHLAHVALDAIQRATANKDTQFTSVSYADIYKRVGFAAKLDPTGTDEKQKNTPSATLGNPAEVFLILHDQLSLSYTNGGERSGGVATPNMQPNAFSRKQGLISGFPPVESTPAPGMSPSLRRVLERRAKAAKNPLVRGKHSVAMRADTGSAAPAAGGFGNPFSPDAKLLGILPLSVFFEAVGLDALPKFIDSIEEGISEGIEDIEQMASRFGDLVKPAIQSIDNELKKDGFYDSDAGKSIQTDISAIAAVADQLHQSAPAELPSRIADLAARLRRLRDDFQAIANHPEALLSVDSIGELTTAVEKIADILKARIDALRKTLVKLAAGATTQLDAFVDQIKGEAAGSLGELSEQFTQLVLTELAAHRSDLANIDAAFNAGLQVRDAFMRLAKLVDLYRKLYIDGFGLLHAIRTILSSKTDPLAGTVARLIDHAGKLRDRVGGPTRKYLTQLYNSVFQIGFSLDTAWQGCQLNQPALAKELAPAFSTLANLLNSYAASSVGMNSPPDNSLELVNRAHRLLSQIDAAIQAIAGKGVVLDNSFEQAWKQLAGAYDLLKADLTLVRADLADVRAALNPQLPLYEAELAIDQFASRTIDVIDLASDTTSTDIGFAIALCEAVGNLLDHRLLGAVTTGAKTGFSGRAPDQILDALSKVAIPAWNMLRPMMEPLSTLHLEPDPTITRILGADFINTTNAVAQSACALALQFGDDGLRASDCQSRKANATLGSCDHVVCKPSQGAIIDLLDLADQIDQTNTALTNWFVTVQKIGPKIESRVLEEIKDQLDGLVERMIPTRTHLDLTLDQTLSDYGGVFIAKDSLRPATLSLEAHIEADLISHTSSSRFAGTVSDFQIDLFDVVTIEIFEVHFEATDGHFHLDQPKIGSATMGGDLKFVEAFQGLMNGKDGPFVDPAPNGIRAGYRMSFPITQLGPFTVQNFGFEVAIEIPFDDRAALISLALATADAPCLISFGVYGGGAYFSMSMAGTKLVSIHAAFEYGLVGAFSFPAVEGTGRVVVGLYFGLEANVAVLRGYFYAGGHATVLDFVSISADLRLSMTYASGSAHGEGRFHVEIGAGPFSWTLSYTVAHSTNATYAGLPPPGLQALDASDSASTVGALTQPTCTSQTICDIDLRDANSWSDYRSAFALDDFIPRGGA